MPFGSDYYYGGMPSSYYSPYANMPYSGYSRISTPIVGYSPLTAILSASIGFNSIVPRRNYVPHLTSISEASSLSPVLKKHKFGNRGSPRTNVSAAYYRRDKPVVIDTDKIDVSSPRDPDKEKRDSISRSGPIQRGRTVVRMFTKKAKENPGLARKKKTPGELLMEKFLIKDKTEEVDEFTPRQWRLQRLQELNKDGNNNNSTNTNKINVNNQSENDDGNRSNIARRGTVKRYISCVKKKSGSLPINEANQGETPSVESAEVIENKIDLDINDDQTIDAQQILNQPRRLSVSSEILKQEAAILDSLILEELSSGSSEVKKPSSRKNSMESTASVINDNIQQTVGESTLKRGLTKRKTKKKANDYAGRKTSKILDENLVEDQLLGPNHEDKNVVVNAIESVTKQPSIKRPTIKRKRSGQLPLKFVIDEITVEESTEPSLPIQPAKNLRKLNYEVIVEECAESDDSKRNSPKKCAKNKTNKNENSSDDVKEPIKTDKIDEKGSTIKKTVDNINKKDNLITDKKESKSDDPNKNTFTEIQAQQGINDVSKDVSTINSDLDSNKNLFSKFNQDKCDIVIIPISVGVNNSKDETDTKISDKDSENIEKDVKPSKSFTTTFHFKFDKDTLDEKPEIGNVNKLKEENKNNEKTSTIKEAGNVKSFISVNDEKTTLKLSPLKAVEAIPTSSNQPDANKVNDKVESSIEDKSQPFFLSDNRGTVVQRERNTADKQSSSLFVHENIEEQRDSKEVLQKDNKNIKDILQRDSIKNNITNEPVLEQTEMNSIHKKIEINQKDKIEAGNKISTAMNNQEIVFKNEIKVSEKISGDQPTPKEKQTIDTGQKIGKKETEKDPSSKNVFEKLSANEMKKPFGNLKNSFEGPNKFGLSKINKPSIPVSKSLESFKSCDKIQPEKSVSEKKMNKESNLFKKSNSKDDIKSKINDNKFAVNKKVETSKLVLKDDKIKEEILPEKEITPQDKTGEMLMKKNLESKYDVGNSSNLESKIIVEDKSDKKIELVKITDKVATEKEPQKKNIIKDNTNIQDSNQTQLKVIAEKSEKSIEVNKNKDQTISKKESGSEKDSTVVDKGKKSADTKEILNTKDEKTSPLNENLPKVVKNITPMTSKEKMTEEKIESKKGVSEDKQKAAPKIGKNVTTNVKIPKEDKPEEKEQFKSTSEQKSKDMSAPSKNVPTNVKDEKAKDKEQPMKNTSEQKSKDMSTTSKNVPTNVKIGKPKDKEQPMKNVSVQKPKDMPAASKNIPTNVKDEKPKDKEPSGKSISHNPKVVKGNDTLVATSKPEKVNKEQTDKLKTTKNTVTKDQPNFNEPKEDDLKNKKTELFPKDNNIEPFEEINNNIKATVRRRLTKRKTILSEQRISLARYEEQRILLQSKNASIQPIKITNVAATSIVAVKQESIEESSDDEDEDSTSEEEEESSEYESSDSSGKVENYLALSLILFLTLAWYGINYYFPYKTLG